MIEIVWIWDSQDETIVRVNVYDPFILMKSLAGQYNNEFSRNNLRKFSAQKVRECKKYQPKPGQEWSREFRIKRIWRFFTFQFHLYCLANAKLKKTIT